jgi:hypothetical protein
MLHEVSPPASLDDAAPRDRVLRWLVFAAVVTSVASFVYFFRRGNVLAYNDAISHMEIARRVIDSPVAGPTQLGSVWLPLPHLLMLPLIGVNRFYFDGFAGSAVSMVSFVVACVLLYKIVRDLTGSRLAAVMGALVFMGNPNILYMQSTPMTELLLFACMLGMTYGLQRWIRTDEPRYLYAAGGAAILGTLTRYEAWVLLLAMFAVVAFVLWRRQRAAQDSTSLDGVFTAFLYVSGLGILIWMIWNWVIFGNPLNFQTGKYAKPSLWVSSADKAVGNWSASLKTYWYAMSDDIRLPIVLLSAVALAVLLVRGRKLVYLPTLALLVLFPFFVLAIERGQRPLHVTQLNGSLYNVRFGLLMVLPAAILVGCLVGWLGRHRPVAIEASVLIGALVVGLTAQGVHRPERIATLAEPLRTQQHTATTDANTAASAYLRSHYSGGLILAQFFGDEDLLFQAHISLGTNVYEGSYQLWQSALRHPVGHHIRWIVMHVSLADDAVNAVASSPELTGYQLVFHNSDYRIYQRRIAS